MLVEVGERLRRVFALPVRLGSPQERPLDAYDARRRQYSSTRILQWLASRAAHPGAKLLGLTDVDLFIPILTFVYGEAQLGGRAALVSTARLSDGPRDLDAPLLPARLAKEAVHELGHTFGLVHCEEQGCVMSRSASLHEVDAKGSALCHDCTILLREAQAGEETTSHERPQAP